jgi:hypothetical protein
VCLYVFLTKAVTIRKGSERWRFVIVLGVILVVLGVIGLVRPNFNDHQQEEVAKLGPIKATVDEEKTAQIPATVSIAVLVAGIGLVVPRPRRKPQLLPSTISIGTPFSRCPRRSNSKTRTYLRAASHRDTWTQRHLESFWCYLTADSAWSKAW